MSALHRDAVPKPSKLSTGSAYMGSMTLDIKIFCDATSMVVQFAKRTKFWKLITTTIQEKFAGCSARRAIPGSFRKWKRPSKVGFLRKLLRILVKSFMTHIVTKMSDPRDFTTMEQAVTDLVNKCFENEGPRELWQLFQIEQFIDNIITVRDLLTAAQNKERVRSSRLKVLNEAFNLVVETTIKQLGEKKLTDSLKRLRLEV